MEVFIEGTIWKFKTCVYGLNDASRTWYMGVHEELFILETNVSKFDAGLFYWHNNGKLEGIMSTHVDDFCWGGTSDFVKNVLNRLRKVFQIGNENCIYIS